MRMFLLAVPAMLIGVSVLAQDDETKCCCTTYDTSVCLGKIHEKVDERLNKVYADALEEFKDSRADVANLKDAERNGSNIETHRAKRSMDSGVVAPVAPML